MEELLRRRDEKIKALGYSCKFCLSVHSEVYYAATELENLALKQCFQLDQSFEELSSIVCSMCYEKLIEIERFRNYCHSAQMKFVNELHEIDRKIQETEEIIMEEVQENAKIEYYTVMLTPSAENSFIETCIEQPNDNESCSKITKNPKSANFICDMCGKIFANNRNYRKHKQNVHLVDFDGEMFSCDLCPVTKPTKRLLYKHMKSVHIVQLTPCDICGKVYRTRELWQKHSLTHNDSKKTHFCQYCPADRSGFICKSALQKHLRKTHGIVQ